MQGSSLGESLLRRVETSRSDSTGDKETDSGEKDKKFKKKGKKDDAEKPKRKKRKGKAEEEDEDEDPTNPLFDDSDGGDDDPDIDGDGGLEVRGHGRPSKRPAAKEPKKGRKRERGEKKKTNKRSRKHDDGGASSSCESDSLMRAVQESMERAEVAKATAHPCIEVDASQARSLFVEAQTKKRCASLSPGPRQRSRRVCLPAL